MRYTIYHSDKGDCTLVTAKNGARLLADGGMSVSYNEFVAPELTKFIADTKHKTLDVVYVSHIDDDHIGGVLKMLDDLMAWRVFDHQKKQGNPSAKAPKAPRPPDIDEIWHNGFKDLLKDNAGPIEDQIAANAIALSGFTAAVAPDAELARAVADHQDLAESIPQAIQLSRRIADGELGIALNRPANGKLMMRRASPTAIKVGSLRVRILAPANADLEKLRQDWDTWLRASQKTLTAINAQAKKDASGLVASSGRFVDPLIAEAVSAAEMLSNTLAKDLAKPLGNRKAITPPNLASLMLLVEEAGKSILLTGDGHADDVVSGLKLVKKLPAKGLHVDILKVPHHGAADNMTPAFAKQITADNYVFCGNGFKTNPELVVIKLLSDARLGAADQLATTNEAATGKFTFWFNCSSAVPNAVDQKKHMKKVEAFVATLVKGSKGRMTAHFMGPTDIAQTIEL